MVGVARRLKQRIEDKPFVTMRRREITEMLREVSGEDSTRIKRAMSEKMEMALLEQGVRVFPSLADTDTEDAVRIFHPQTKVADIVDVIARPDASTDRELEKIIAKLKKR